MQRFVGEGMRRRDMLTRLWTVGLAGLRRGRMRPGDDVEVLVAP